jgi:VanZ family protein
MNNFLKFWLPVICWMAVIFVFSSIPSLKSGLKEDYILRKLAHTLEYMILAILLFRAFSVQKIPLMRAITYASIVGVIYAFSDEFHQGFILGRERSLKDVGIDSIGVLIGDLVCYIKNRKYPAKIGRE